MKEIKAWYEATDKLREIFVKKYFGKDAEWYWVADCIGDTLYVNDRFFNLEDIIDYLENNYTRNQMFDYYDYRLDCHDKNISPINPKNYLKLNAKK